jgi:hypothetical protein
MDLKTRKKVAQDILVVAKELVAAEQSRTMVAADVPAELEATAKAAAGLAQQFKDTHAALIAEVNDLEKKLKDQKTLLKNYYKDWSKKSGYDATKKAVLAQAQQCLETGEVLEDLADDLEVGKRESTQESYKEKYNILVSMLNEAELKKYSRLLNAFFRKQTTELKTGVKELDGTVKEWHEQAQEIAKERGIKLPRASKMASAMDRAKERNAGILDALMDAIRSIIPNLIRKVVDWGKRFFKRVTRNGEELDDISNDLLALAAKAQRTLG